MKTTKPYPRIIDTHDWISIDLGNGRRLTTSRYSDKVSGAVPQTVADAWFRMIKDFRASPDEQKPDAKPFLRAIEKFADGIPTLWPEWNAPAPTFVVGQVVSFDFGPKRGGVEQGPVVKVGRTTATVRFPKGGLISIPKDLLATGGA